MIQNFKSTIMLRILSFYPEAEQGSLKVLKHTHPRGSLFFFTLTSLDCIRDGMKDDSNLNS